MRNFLILIAAIVLAVWYFRKNPDPAPAPTGSGASELSRGPGCLVAAESANRSLAEATQLLLAMPVEASRWSEAESAASGAMSRAESACSGGATDSERDGMEKARDAVSLMRSTLAEASKAALGAGGFQGATRQEAIDNRLASARAKMGVR